MICSIFFAHKDIPPAQNLPPMLASINEGLFTMSDMMNNINDTTDSLTLLKNQPTLQSEC